MDLLSKTTAAFGADGSVARAVGLAYSPRTETQIRAAQIVATGMTTSRDVIINAGTGTGKTLAYLVPLAIEALESRNSDDGALKTRALIVTANNSLLQQIDEKDGPIIETAFPGIRIRTMKGTENYLCLDQLERNRGKLPLYLTDENIKAIDQIEAWTPRTQTGDRAELDIDDSVAWRRYSVSSRRCTGRDCVQYQACLVRENRSLAEKADIVVTNYAYLLSMLSTGRAGKWLSSFHRIVCDEAHELADEARDRLGWEITTRSISSAAYYASTDTKRQLESETRARFEIWNRMSEKSTESAYRLKAGELKGSSIQALLSKVASETEDRIETTRRPDIKRRMNLALESLGEHIGWLDDAETINDPSLVIYLRRDQIKASILNPASRLRIMLWSQFPGRAILSSATLSTGGKDPFDFIRKETGICTNPLIISVPSPFDFYTRTLLYTPKTGPLADDGDDYPFWSAGEALKLVRMVDGKVLILCTSLTAVKMIGGRLKEAGERVLIQGVDGRREGLIRSLRAGKARILIGSQSLGTGLDLPGLDMVIIDKIPYPQLGDPVMSALREGMDFGPWFSSIYLPRAIMTWVQWFGRLMRRTTDRGIVATLDRRLVEKSYRSRFGNAKPRTRVFRGRASLERAWKKLIRDENP